MAKKIDLAEGLTHFKAKENASIAITEATSTASAPHKAGEYFYYKGDLVIATADIAQGGTITLNTNCKKQPLADSVCELKTALDAQFDGILNKVTADYSQIDLSRYTIDGSNKWIQQGTTSKSRSKTIQIPDNVIRIDVIPSQNSSIIAFLNSNTPEVGATPDFSTNYQARIQLYNSTSYIVEPDMKYIYAVDTNTSNETMIPTVIFNFATDNTLTKSGIAADSYETGAKIESVKTKLYNESLELSNNKWSTMSNGELYELPLTGNVPFTPYIVEDGNIVESDEVYLGTDYIKAPRYVVFAFDNADTTARIYIYFYTKSGSTYTLRWDVLDITTSTNKKNLLGLNSSCNRVLEIPEGTYMRISNPIEGNVKIFGWTGKHFGCEVSGCLSSPENGDSYVSEAIAESGKTGILIPGSVKLIFGKDILFQNIWGAKGNDRELILTDGRVQTFLLPDGYDYFISRISLNATIPYNGSSPSASQYAYLGNLNDSISMLVPYQAEKPFGKASDVSKRGNKINKIKWTCLNNNLSVSNSELKFKYNARYAGIPYMSRWTKPCYLGWHISAHTFVNAANDVRSVFYKENGRNGGPGYGLVCSSFNCLISGFPYPLTNYCFMNDPFCRITKNNKPLIGMIATKGDEHCVIPDVYGCSSDFEQYSIYEQITPITSRTTNYSFTNNSSSPVRNYSYLNDYVYSVEHVESINGFNAVYDLEDVTLVNGDARPYRGDRCVFTSDDTIKINIKNSSATICYYQPCTYDLNTDTFTLTGVSQSAQVQTDDSYYVDIDKTTISDGFYAVWTDTSDVKEYFEYHTAPVCTYTISENNFAFNVPDDEFWYVCFWQSATVSGRTEIIPYVTNGDYSKFRAVYEPAANASGYIFFKGVLGAYVASLSIAT